MSQFKFQNDINKLLNLDGELKMQSNKPRWQRKMENSINGSNASKLSVSYNNSYISAMAGNSTITNNKTPNKSIAEAGCSKRKTPNDKKSPGKKDKICFDLCSFDYVGFDEMYLCCNSFKGGGDRFIPNRGATNFELGNYLVGFSKAFFHLDLGFMIILLFQD